MRRGSWKIRIFIGLALVAFAFIQKCSNKEDNPYTGRSQHINMAVMMNRKVIYVGFFLGYNLGRTLTR